MSKLYQQGATSVRMRILIRDSTTLQGKTGLLWNTAGLAFAFSSGPGGAATAITLASNTVGGSWVSGGFVEVDATKMPGTYQFDAPNAVCAAGVAESLIQWKGTGLLDDGVEIDLTAFDPTTIDKTNFSLTSAESDILHSGTAQAGAGSTITLAAGASSTDDLYKGNLVKLYGGVGAAQVRTIIGYSGSTKVATVDRPWALNPTGTSTYAVLAKSSAKLDASLQTTAASVQGNVTGNVGGNVVGNVGGSVVGSVAAVVDKAGFSLAAAGLDPVLDAANGVETAFSLRGFFRVVAAALVGKEGGRGTGTTTFRAAVSDSKTRITAQKDGTNNRVNISVDQT